MPLGRPGSGRAAVVLALLRSAPLPAASDPRWPAVVDLVVAHGLAPLVHAQVPGLPPQVRARLKTERAQELARHLAQEALLTRAFAALAPLPGVPLKGAATGALYAQPELRPKGDVDLLVLPRDFDEACRRLGEAGFVRHPRALGGAEDLRGWHERTFTLGAGAGAGQALDLHRGFLQEERLRYRAEDVFARSAPWPARAPHARSASPEDQLLLLALSVAAKELCVPLVLACDLARLLPAVAPASLGARARELRLSRAVGLSLSWLSAVAGAEGRVGGAPVDAQAVAEARAQLGLRPATLRALAALAGSHDLARGRLPRLVQLWRKARLLDCPQDAARLLWRTLSEKVRGRRED